MAKYKVLSGFTYEPESDGPAKRWEKGDALDTATIQGSPKIDVTFLVKEGAIEEAK
jgi:hypothetical protein